MARARVSVGDADPTPAPDTPVPDPTPDPTPPAPAPAGDDPLVGTYIAVGSEELSTGGHEYVVDPATGQIISRRF